MGAELIPEQYTYGQSYVDTLTNGCRVEDQIPEQYTYFRVTRIYMYSDK